MNKKIFDKKTDIIIFQRNLLIIVSTILLFIVLLLSVCLLKKNNTTILVPLDFNSKISLKTNRPHNTYLEAVSRDIITTMLNLTPNNLEYAEKTILSLADSSSYGILKTQFEKLKRNIILKKINTMFYPISIYPDNSKMTVIIDGILYNYLGQKEVSKQEKKYEIRYNYKYGRISIIGFSEIVRE